MHAASRRDAIKLLGFGALPLFGQIAKPKRPTVCILSSALTGVGYAEIGEIVKQLGFDGVDITMMRGGIVEPQLAPVDEVRALESIHGAGLAAPIVTTALRTPADPWCRTLLALAGRTGVPLAKIGPAPRRETAALAYIGREYSIAVLAQAGGSGQMTLADARTMLADIDPAWSGICLHSRVFAPESDVSDDELRDAMPRLKAVTIADHNAQGPQSLGHGTVNFDKMFALLARVGFSGPLTVERTYKTPDEPGALTRDAEFMKKHMDAAYGGMRT